MIIPKFEYLAVVANNPHDFASDYKYEIRLEDGRDIEIMKTQFEWLKSSGLIKKVQGEWPCSIYYPVGKI